MSAEQVKLDVIKMLKAHVDVPGLANDLIDNVLQPALKSAVDKSATKLDDVAFAALYPILAQEVKKLIKAQWDLLLTAPSAPAAPANPKGNPL